MRRRLLVQFARDAKHAQFVLRRRLPEVGPAIRDRAYRAWDRIRPYSYKDDSILDSFVSVTPKVHDFAAITSPTRQVFVIWAGDNPLTDNRAAALSEIHSRVRSTEVVVVTPANLGAWVLAGSPLHAAYPHLSLVHRSDYLRAYLMHHHGGTYLDIKRGYGDIDGALQRLASAPGKWLVGYRELGADYVSDEAGSIHRALRLHHSIVVGTACFAARPHTPLTAEWLSEIERRLDEWAVALEKHPGNAFGTTAGYPVPWAALNGAILQPLCLKYAERVMLDDRFRPSFEDYR